MKNASTEQVSGFFVLEGLDGAGTTTQVQGLVGALNAQGISAVATGEPTGFETGRFVRQVLSGTPALRPETLAFLFAADRHEHLHRPQDGILATLQGGTTVICDRYLFSSLAYQGIDCDPTLVADLNASFPLPQAVVFLEVSVEECMRRLGSRGSKEIFEHADFLQKVLARYEEILDDYEGRGLEVLRLDGTRPPEDLTRCILEFFRNRR